MAVGHETVCRSVERMTLVIDFWSGEQEVMRHGQRARVGVMQMVRPDRLKSLAA